MLLIRVNKSGFVGNSIFAKIFVSFEIITKMCLLEITKVFFEVTTAGLRYFYWFFFIVNSWT